MTAYFDFVHCFSSFVIYLDMEWTVHDRVCVPFFLHKFFPVLFIGYSLLSDQPRGLVVRVSGCSS